MLFNSLEYVAFLLAVFLLYWATARHARVSLGLLLGASYLFYACWNPIYLLLIWFSSTVDWVLGLAMGQARTDRGRKRYIAVSVVYNLGILATFKYFNFFLDNTNWLLQHLDLPELGIDLKLLLPVGISFFTFQSMSYLIDIYRKEIEPTKSYVEYLAFVSFFPQLVSGPIVRAKQFLPQITQRGTLTDEMGTQALVLIALGLVKKLAIADYLAVNLVDRTFSLPYQYSSLEVLVGVYGYAIQIYCDFSGYSDIAIGSALLLGFRFPQNFDAPYKSTSLQEFWRRWHVSLSSWLRDYLYIPLGGSRGAPWKTWRNLLLTMLLGGLWHGAAWTFVVWGALHGGALAVERAFTRQRERLGLGPLFRGSAGKVLAGVLTFHYVCLAWIFFRAPTLDDAFAVLGQIAQGTMDTVNLSWALCGVLAVGFVTHLFPERPVRHLLEGFGRLPTPVQGAALLAVGLSLWQVAGAAAVPFIYFQF